MANRGLAAWLDELGVETGNIHNFFNTLKVLSWRGAWVLTGCVEVWCVVCDSSEAGGQQH